VSSRLRLRVSTSELESELVTVAGESYHYLARVRRAAVGDGVELFDGTGKRRPATIASASSTSMQLRATGPVIEELSGGGSLVSIVPLIKGDRMDFAIAKLTELGVTKVRVAQCERCVVSLDGERARKRLDRFRRVASDAARQSGRDNIPAFEPLMSFSDAVAECAGNKTRLIFHPGGGPGLRSKLAEPDVGFGGIALATGPEGGFTDSELAAAQASGFEQIRLGAHVLRAETAAMAVVAAVSALCGSSGKGEVFDSMRVSLV